MGVFIGWLSASANVNYSSAFGYVYYQDLWYIWIWLGIMPIASGIVLLTQLFNPTSYNWAFGGSSDVAFAVLWYIQAAAFSGVYWGLYYSRQLEYLGIPAYINMQDLAFTTLVSFNTRSDLKWGFRFIHFLQAFDLIIGFLYTIVGGSLCCCQCLPAPK